MPVVGEVSLEKFTANNKVLEHVLSKVQSIVRHLVRCHHTSWLEAPISECLVVRIDFWKEAGLHLSKNRPNTSWNVHMPLQYTNFHPESCYMKSKMHIKA